MGAWGVGSFENDDALDWAWTLDDDTDGSVLRSAFGAVAEAGPDEYVDAGVAACAIAAAEVVAAATGSPAPTLPEEVRRWVASHGSVVGADLVSLARSAVPRARDDSELRELWDEAGVDEWLANVNGLLDRLPQSGH